MYKYKAHLEDLNAGKIITAQGRDYGIHSMSWALNQMAKTLAAKPACHTGAKLNSQKGQILRPKAKTSFHKNKNKPLWQFIPKYNKSTSYKEKMNKNWFYKKLYSAKDR